MLIDFPQQNEYFDRTVSCALRTAFELFKRDDLMSDLVSHFRRQAAAAPTPHDAIFPRLALSTCGGATNKRGHRRNDQGRRSLPPESELRLDLAELLLQQGVPADALELLDAVQPLDNMSLKRREELAISAAIAAGNLERARHAAERLFGLRLDTETQIRLSGQMHQLGLHELAEALLGRARRRAGGQASLLVELMTQFSAGKLEQAAQIAMQVLRASRNGQSTPATYRACSIPTPAEPPRSGSWRRRAGCRSSSSARREQVKKTPNSVAIHQTLADYYTAARPDRPGRAGIARIVELRPDDADLRMRSRISSPKAGILTPRWQITRLSSTRNPPSPRTGSPPCCCPSTEPARAPIWWSS